MLGHSSLAPPASTYAGIMPRLRDDARQPTGAAAQRSAVTAGSPAFAGNLPKWIRLAPIREGDGSELTRIRTSTAKLPLGPAITGLASISAMEAWACAKAASLAMRSQSCSRSTFGVPRNPCSKGNVANLRSISSASAAPIGASRTAESWTSSTAAPPAATTTRVP